MSSNDAPRPNGPLAVAMALAAVAGFLDAHIFVNVVQVFVANMSGNLVLLGIAAGDQRWEEVGIHLLAIAMFSAGVGAATFVHDRRRSAGLPLRPDLLLLVEAVLLVVVVVAHRAQGATEVLTVDGWDVPVVGAGALAMGIQAGVIGKVGSVAVSTTYESGSVAMASQETALAAAATPDQRGRHVTAVRVLSAVLISYVVGAALAAALGSSGWWVVAMTVVVLVLAVVLRVRLGGGSDQSSARMP